MRRGIVWTPKFVPGLTLSVDLWDTERTGQVLQTGDTPKVYRHPETLRVAQVFSDPPLNIVGIEKKNGTVQYAGGIQAPASGLYASLVKTLSMPGGGSANGSNGNGNGHAKTEHEHEHEHGGLG